MDQTQNFKQPTRNKNQLTSFKNAFRGISVAIRESSHLRFHFSVAIAVLVLGILFQISIFEWMLVILAAAGVISSEIVNTAIEDIENVIRDKAGVSYEFTGKGKDLASGAVLICAIAAATIGLIIFLPKLLALL